MMTHDYLSQWAVVLEHFCGEEELPLRPSEIMMLQQGKTPLPSALASSSAVSTVPGSILPQPEDGMAFRLKARLQTTLEQNGESALAAEGAVGAGPEAARTRSEPAAVSAAGARTSATTAVPTVVTPATRATHGVTPANAGTPSTEVTATSAPMAAAVSMSTSALQQPEDTSDVSQPSRRSVRRVSLELEDPATMSAACETETDDVILTASVAPSSTTTTQSASVAARPVQNTQLARPIDTAQQPLQTPTAQSHSQSHSHSQLHSHSQSRRPTQDAPKEAKEDNELGLRVPPPPAPVAHVAWSTPAPGYSPVEYTHAVDKDDERRSDPADPSALDFNAKPSETDLVDRVSCSGQYAVVDGRPLNPLGRTGYTGRGVLLRWGPNRARYYAVTRFARNPDGRQALKTGKPLLEVLLRVLPSGGYALPGGHTHDAGLFLRTLQEETAAWEQRCESETGSGQHSGGDGVGGVGAGGVVTDTRTRTSSVTSANAANAASASATASTASTSLPAVVAASSTRELLRVVDARPAPYIAQQSLRADARNTDNAWVEAAIVNYHDAGTLLHVLPPHFELPAAACSGGAGRSGDPGYKPVSTTSASTPSASSSSTVTVTLTWVPLFCRLAVTPAADLTPLGLTAAYRTAYFGTTQPVLPQGSFCTHRLWKGAAETETETESEVTAKSPYGFTSSHSTTTAQTAAGPARVKDSATSNEDRKPRNTNGASGANGTTGRRSSVSDLASQFAGARQRTRGAHTTAESSSDARKRGGDGGDVSAAGGGEERRQSMSASDDAFAAGGRMPWAGSDRKDKGRAFGYGKGE